MMITKELIVFLYDFVNTEDLGTKFINFEKFAEKLNIGENNLISQIKEISKKNLYSEKKEKDLSISDDLIKSLFELFLKEYSIYNQLRHQFLMSIFTDEDISHIKTIDLGGHYISCASSMLRLYKKTECNEVNKYLFYYNKGKYIDLYEFKLGNLPIDQYINDLLKICRNEIIVLFINMMFLFKIENDDFKLISLIKERYRLVKCCKYDKNKILVGSDGNLLIYEKKNNFSFQKIATYNFLNCPYRKNFYLFNDIIIMNNYKSLKIFSIDKKFKLTKSKNDYSLSKYIRANLCFMKKLDLFILFKRSIIDSKLLLTDFDKIYDDLKLDEYPAVNIQEYSENDEFLILFLKDFKKYKIENNKIKLLFTISITNKDNFHDYLNIKQISNDLYFITGMSGYKIYKYDQKDEKNLIES